MREVIRRKKRTVLGSGMCVVAIMALALFAWSPNQADAVQGTDSAAGMEVLSVPGFLDDDGWCEIPIAAPTAFPSAYSQELTDDPVWAPRAGAGGGGCWTEYEECLADGCLWGFCNAMYKLCQAVPAKD